MQCQCQRSSQDRDSQDRDSQGNFKWEQLLLQGACIQMEWYGKGQHLGLQIKGKQWANRAWLAWVLRLAHSLHLEGNLVSKKLGKMSLSLLISLLIQMAQLILRLEALLLVKLLPVALLQCHRQ
jgi:hypothetical protein